MNVIEIFKSIDGEGKRVGLPVVFVRFAGCNLRCSYCDTKYSYGEGDNPIEPKKMSVTEIESAIFGTGIREVTLTGGEPLWQSDIITLIRNLCERGYRVNVETNGSLIPPMFPSVVRENLFYTMDYKCNSSGMSDHMDMDAINSLDCQDVLKFVVGSKGDMDQAAHVVHNMRSRPQVYFSPVFGSIEPKEIVEYLLKNKLYDCKVQVQLHKIIWAPEERGV